MSDDQVAQVIVGFKEFAVLVEPKKNLEVIKDDPDDDKFIECAVAGEAIYIISSDAHLLELREYEDIRILSPTVFLALLDLEEGVEP